MLKKEKKYDILIGDLFISTGEFEMNGIGFDNQRYLELQSKHIRERIEKFGGKLYLEFGVLKGIAIVAGMESIDVPGTTGNIDTNYLGKAEYALDALRRHDFVYIHVEAPDECGHRGEADNKVKAIEDIDKYIVGTLLEGLKGEDFTMAILPDHPTPIGIRTHASTPVPYIIYRSDKKVEGVSTYTELYAESTGIFRKYGDELVDIMIGK